MGRRVAGVLLLVSLFPAVAAWAAKFEKEERHALAPGSKLRVEMSVGELRIVGGGGPGLRVRLSAKVGLGSVAELERQVEIRFRPGREAELAIRTAEGFRRAFQNVSIEVEVTVPTETHLNADLGVGELRIQGVEGDLRAHVGVGELRLEVPDPMVYKSVRAKAGIGDVRHPFRSLRPEREHVSGWLGKRYESSFSKGRYRLDAEVGVGEVRISEARVI